MKKNSKFAATFCILLLICSGVVVSTKMLSNDKNSKHNQSSGEIEYMYNVIVEKPHDLIDISDLVIVGKVVKKEAYSDRTSAFTVEVKDSYLHNYSDKEILVNELHDTLNVGDEYMLFLVASESIYHPRIIFTSAHKEFILNLSSEDIKKNGKFMDNDIKEIVKTLEQIEKKTDKLELKKINKFDSNEEAVTSSDLIIDVTITEVYEINNKIDDYYFKINNSYKGESDLLGMLLPSGYEIGDRLIILLKDTGRGHELSSRESSIINYNDKESVEEILELTNK